MGEMQFRITIHQLQGGTERAFCGLPGIGHRPEPSQIEMSVPDPMQTTPGVGLKSEVLSHQIHASSESGSHASQLSGMASTSVPASSRASEADIPGDPDRDASVHAPAHW